eukprot:2758558-Amphidinium_carterae.1
MGRDAESLVVDALPMQLGIGVRLWILDRRDEVPLTSTDLVPSPDSPIIVHVLYKPGHYDLLYLRPPDIDDEMPAQCPYEAQTFKARLGP